MTLDELEAKIKDIKERYQGCGSLEIIALSATNYYSDGVTDLTLETATITLEQIQHKKDNCEVLTWLENMVEEGFPEPAQREYDGTNYRTGGSFIAIHTMLSTFDEQ